MYQIKEFMVMASVGTLVGLQQNGVSTTRGRDVLRYDCFIGFRGRDRVQWDYRDQRGNLHTAVCSTLEIAREQAAQYGYVEGQSKEVRV
jgi:hypothetical protein